MNRITSTLFALLFVVTTTIAQNPKSLLWEISGNGLEKPSYLFGTIHLTCPEDLKISDAAKKALNDSEQLYLEVNLDGDAMMQMQQKLLLPQGQKVTDYLTGEDYKVVDEYIKSKLGVGLAQFGEVKPLMLFSFTLVTFLPCQPQSYDMAFMKMAKEANKPILGLETMDFQLAIFDSIPRKEMAHIIADMIKRKDVAMKEFNQISEYYKAQDIDKLMELAAKSEWNFANFQEIFIDRRNTSWVPIIEKAAKQKPVFIAVGALHLGGEKGVLQLLRNAGYTVKALNE